MSAQELGAVCGAGHVLEHAEQRKVEYRGREGNVAAYFKRCDTCGSEYADADLSRKNKRSMLAFRKSVEGLLTGQEILALRRRYGINQRQAALIFGGGPVAFSKYENDDVAHSEAMDKLLRLAARDESVFKTLARDAGLGKELSPTAAEAAQWMAAGFRRVHRDTSTNVIYVAFAATTETGNEFLYRRDFVSSSGTETNRKFS